MKSTLLTGEDDLLMTVHQVNSSDIELRTQEDIDYNLITKPTKPGPQGYSLMSAFDTLPIDKNNTIYRVSFLYGIAILAPQNAIISTLDFFNKLTPSYPISFVVSFAINGVMVIVVLLCIAYSEVGSNKIKINLMFFLTGLLLLAIPILTAQSKIWFGELACFWIAVALMVLLGVITAVS